MKTPPAKQEEKLISILHLLLLVTSGLCLSWENNVSGIMPNRKVMIVMASKVITYKRRNYPIFQIVVLFHRLIYAMRTF